MKQIREIKELLNIEWMKSHSVVMNGDPDGRTDYYKDLCEYIRYLQDQIEKICSVDIPNGILDIHQIRCEYIRDLQDQIEKICSEYLNK